MSVEPIKNSLLNYCYQRHLRIAHTNFDNKTNEYSAVVYGIDGRPYELEYDLKKKDWFIMR